MVALTTSNGSYDVQKIKESFSERQKGYLLFRHALTGCDTVSSIAGHGKQLYLTGNNDNTTINNNNHHHHCHNSKNIKNILITCIVCLFHIILFF